MTSEAASTQFEQEGSSSTSTVVNTEVERGILSRFWTKAQTVVRKAVNTVTSGVVAVFKRVMTSLGIWTFTGTLVTAAVGVVCIVVSAMLPMSVASIIFWLGVSAVTVAAMAVVHFFEGMFTDGIQMIQGVRRKAKEVFGDRPGEFIFWLEVGLFGLVALALCLHIRPGMTPVPKLSLWGSRETPCCAEPLTRPKPFIQHHQDTATVTPLTTIVLIIGFCVVMVITNSGNTDGQTLFEPSTSNDSVSVRQSGDVISADDFICQKKFHKKIEDWEKYVKAVSRIKKSKFKVEDDNENIEISDTHMLIYGNPGTGKTTAARIMGHILAKYEVVKDNFVECNATHLVGQARGQSAVKTREMVDKAMNGVLFIDEAYYLDPKGELGDLGGEALAELLVHLDKRRDSFVCILAGYEDRMQRLLGANPGLEGRFAHVVRLEDYSTDNLLEMLTRMAGRDKLEIDQEVSVQWMKKGPITKWCLTEQSVPGEDSKKIPKGQARALRQLYNQAKRNYTIRKADMYEERKLDGDTEKTFEEFCKAPPAGVPRQTEALKRHWDDLEYGPNNWDPADEHCRKRRRTMTAQDFDIDPDKKF